MSGGIDSSLVATVASDALGPENVVGISNPSQFSSEGSVADARQLASNLGIRFHIIPIADVYFAYERALSDMFRETEFGTAEENIQSRVRGNIWMALSNKFGWQPVLTCGNKSEMATGYATLYGDMAGGFAVIRRAKTLVYELARYRNAQAGHSLIPDVC
jgi:NAD+ synthase (glutamine-hydrolysing)